MRKNQAMNVRLNRNGKMLNFSSLASAQFEGYSDVAVYEKAGVAAVRGTLSGGYHISGEVGRPRKALSNARLVEYLCEKFGCALGSTLPAWTGEQEGVLFFGGMQAAADRWVLDERFAPIEVEYNRRVGDWAYVHDNWIEFTREVREALPERMSAFRCGRVVLLSGDPAGKLVLTPRRQRGNHMLVSHALADHLRSLYDGEESGMRLHAAPLPGGVALAGSLELLAAVNLTRPERLALDESKYCFLTPGTRGTLYLSASAWEQLEGAERVDVYHGEGCLALGAAREGGLRVTESGYAHYIHSKRLFTLVKKRWPEAKKLHLLRYGELWLLWPSTARPAGLPPAAQFQRLDMAGRTDLLTTTEIGGFGERLYDLAAPHTYSDSYLDDHTQLTENLKLYTSLLGSDRFTQQNGALTYKLDTKTGNDLIASLTTDTYPAPTKGCLPRRRPVRLPRRRKIKRRL